MYEKLEGFVQKIPEFLKKTSSEMIIYFVYYDFCVICGG